LNGMDATVRARGTTVEHRVVSIAEACGRLGERMTEVVAEEGDAKRAFCSIV